MAKMIFFKLTVVYAVGLSGNLQGRETTAELERCDVSSESCRIEDVPQMAALLQLKTSTAMNAMERANSSMVQNLATTGSAGAGNFNTEGACAFLDWTTNAALGKAKYQRCTTMRSRKGERSASVKQIKGLALFERTRKRRRNRRNRRSGAWLVESSKAPATCAPRPSAFMVYENVRLAENQDGLALFLTCGRTPASEQETHAEVDGILPEVFESASECKDLVKDETILVQNPRMEYLQNFYHAIEEVFSLGQTKRALGERFGRSTRLVFAWTGSAKDDSSGPAKFYQPGTDSPGELVASGIPQIAELFAQIMMPKKKLPALNLAEVTGKGNPGLCFRRLILPMRACSGSVVPASWEERGCTAPAENPFVSLPRRVLGAFHIPRSASRPEGAALVVLWIHRAQSERGGRYISNDNDLVRSIGRSLGELSLIATQNEAGAELELRADMAVVQRIRQGLPHADVSSVDFKDLSMAEQLRRVADVDVLVGRHGAGLAHLLFSKPTARVVELTSYPPPVAWRSVANIFYNFAKWSFREYASVKVGEIADLSPEVMDRTAETVQRLANKAGDQKKVR